MTGTPSYGDRMAGRGAWTLLEVDDAMHGALWTDYRTNLGLASLPGTDPRARSALMTQINACAAAGVTVRHTWGAVLTHYGLPTVYEGELSDLAAELTRPGALSYRVTNLPSSPGTGHDQQGRTTRGNY